MRQRSIDSPLVPRTRASDADSLALLLDSLARRVCRPSHGIAHSAADAEDIVPNVFIGLLKPEGNCTTVAGKP
jgi:hypothetical protein